MVTAHSTRCPSAVTVQCVCQASSAESTSQGVTSQAGGAGRGIPRPTPSAARTRAVVTRPQLTEPSLFLHSVSPSSCSHRSLSESSPEKQTDAMRVVGSRNEEPDESKGCVPVDVPVTWGTACMLARPSPDYTRPTRLRENNLLFPKSCLNVNLVQKRPHRNSWNNA